MNIDERRAEIIDAIETLMANTGKPCGQQACGYQWNGTKYAGECRHIARTTCMVSDLYRQLDMLDTTSGVRAFEAMEMLRIITAAPEEGGE